MQDCGHIGTEAVSRKLESANKALISYCHNTIATTLNIL